MMMSGINSDHDPGAVDKFRAGDDGSGNGRGERSDPVHGEFALPVGASLGEPTADHAGLREREREENADGVKRNERMGITAEGNNQKAGKGTKDHNAIGEHEPVAHHGHLMRHIAVSGQE